MPGYWSREQREAARQRRLGKKLGPRTAEVKAKISRAQKGIPRNWSEAGLKRVIASRFKLGVSIPKPEGFGAKMSAILRAKNGGASVDSRQYREVVTWRNSVLERDRFTCQKCRVTDEVFLVTSQRSEDWRRRKGC